MLYPVRNLPGSEPGVMRLAMQFHTAFHKAWLTWVTDARPILPPLAVNPVPSEQDEAMSEENQDVISIDASWDRESISQPEVQDTTQEVGLSSEIASEADTTPPSSSI
ncbi:UNVERIFIED_CONTAM: hypothetical protein FKN15_013139 [Acipenser sinensis]